jgi:hypothetical protein
MRARTVGWTITSIAALGTLVGGVAAACSAADAGGGAVGGGGNTATAEGTGNNAGNVDGDNDGCVAVGGDCNYVEPEPVDPADPDEAIEQEIFRATPPDGEGPWPFTVLYEGGQGLFVRTGPHRDDFRLGYTNHATTVWVDCVTTSDFDPVPSLDTGPTWYRVHWPNSERSDEGLSSEPADPAQGFAYAGYLRPNGHNGDVPECDGSAD